jgi:hypothetical protein
LIAVRLPVDEILQIVLAAQVSGASKQFELAMRSITPC